MSQKIFNVEDLLASISRQPLSLDEAKPHFFLIIPPSSQIPTPGREFFLRAPMEGPSYISTTLKNAGYDVKIVDYRTGGLPLEEILKDNKAVIGIATFADSYIFIEGFIREIRERNKDIPIILGGSFVSSAPEVLMNNLAADYAVLGEAELTILELMDALFQEKLEFIFDIPGICYRRDGKLVFTKPRTQIASLDNLPLLDIGPWPNIKNSLQLKKMGFSSSRGCYNKCSFCFKTIPEVKQMSADKFGKEIKYFAGKYGLKFLFLNDLTFVIDTQRTIQLCRELKESGMHWACSTRVESVDEELLQIMKDSGCEEIWYGIESVDQKVLDVNCKRITTENIEHAVRMTNKAGIKVMANLIIGLLGETQGSLDKMIEFIETQDVVPCSIKYLTPFPGTYVYHYARKNGLIKDEIAYFRSLSRRKVNYADDEIINCTDIPIDRLREAFKKIRAVSYERYGSLDWN